MIKRESPRFEINQYPRDMSFVDRKGKLVQPTKEDFNSKRRTYIGEAYAVFNCSASADEIRIELPKIRHLVQTPKELELTLREGFDWDSKFGKEIYTPVAQLVSSVLPIINCRYFMHARYPNATNKDAADEVASILNQAYQSPLYKEREKFWRKIFYEENGLYVPRD